MTWQVLNPYDQECIGSVELVDWPQIDRWLDEARALHEDRQARLPAHERIAILQRASVLMRERAETLAFPTPLQSGEPLRGRPHWNLDRPSPLSSNNKNSSLLHTCAAVETQTGSLRPAHCVTVTVTVKPLQLRCSCGNSKISRLCTGSAW